MFVVITLIAGAQERSGTASQEDVAAYGSPTVVHFCAVLLVSAILSAPWRVLAQASHPLGLSGLGGVMYAGIVVRRLLRRARHIAVERFHQKKD